MSFIYKITNRINGKGYIGKTNLPTIQERFKEHCCDSKRRSKENRPLYRAINKYGEQNFIIEQIEECSPEVASEREKYWIDFFNTYRNGYNATMGGDGSQVYDYNLFINEYQNGLTIKAISEKYKCDSDTVSIALKNYGIKVLPGQDWSKKFLSNPVIAINKNTKEIHKFNSYSEAAKWILENNFSKSTEKDVVGKIGLVCRKIRKTAYGFYWENENKN